MMVQSRCVPIHAFDTTFGTHSKFLRAPEPAQPRPARQARPGPRAAPCGYAEATPNIGTQLRANRQKSSVLSSWGWAREEEEGARSRPGQL